MQKELNISICRTEMIKEDGRYKTKYILQITITLIIFWDFLMFHQVFLSPQVKRDAIITYKHGL